MINSTPSNYIFFKGGWLYKTGNVKIDSVVKKLDITTVYFKVKSYKVRLKVERISPNIYVKEFTCDCDDGRNIKHHNICSHICSAITYYCIKLAYKKD